MTHGRVLLDGVDVAGLGVDALRRQLAVIPQDPVLFSGTIRSVGALCCTSMCALHCAPT